MEADVMSKGQRWKCQRRRYSLRWKFDPYEVV